MTGWPDPERPGVPLNPGRDGWHWLAWEEEGRPFAAYWRRDPGEWDETDIDPSNVVDVFYLAPCLTPAEVAAAVIAEREACAVACEAQLRNTDLLLSNPPQSSAAWDARNAIRARPAPAGGDALAAAVAAARREGIEAAAAEIDCGCACRSDVLAAKSKYQRAALCGREPCSAVDAAAIRALARQPDPDLARDFTAWTEGQSDG